MGDVGEAFNEYRKVVKTRKKERANKNMEIIKQCEFKYITDMSGTVLFKTGLPLLLCACQDRRGLPQFCFYKNVIYRFDNYIIEEDDYINKFSRNSDGSIGFVCLFYNGGTCFSEELQDGLDILLNEESKNEYR